jgi:hypothetical protein
VTSSSQLLAFGVQYKLEPPPHSVILSVTQGLLGYAVALLVEALWYKPEGRGFGYVWDHWIFSMYLVLSAAL